MSRTPPSNFDSEIPSRCASRSQIAFSRVALAIGLPRTSRKIFWQSPPCSGAALASIGPNSLTIPCQAGSVDSAEKNGRSPAVHSPQPVSPSDRTSARMILRLGVTPKLVSNGRTRGRCSSRRMIASIFIVFKFPEETTPTGIASPAQRFHFLPHPVQNRERLTPEKMPFETSRDSATELQEHAPVLPRCSSTRRWRQEPEFALQSLVYSLTGLPHPLKGLPSREVNRAAIPPTAGPSEARPAVEMRIYHRNQ